MINPVKSLAQKKLFIQAKQTGFLFGPKPHIVKTANQIFLYAEP